VSKTGVVDFQNNVPFGRSEDASKAGILKMTAFSPDVVMMPFSLVVADNLQGLEKDGKDLLIKGKMTTGVISSDGRIVNDRFSFDTADNLDIEITKTNNKFEMRLNSDIFQGATVVATPHFYAESGTQYPKNIGDISIALKLTASNSSVFTVRAGLDGSDVDDSLGYNFIAVSTNSSNSTLLPVKHGYIDPFLKTNATYGFHKVEFLFNEASTVPLDTAPEYGLTGIYGDKGGVEITFDGSKYIDIPSVLVSPVYKDGAECSNISFTKSEGPSIAVPFCVVETITKTGCYVKCGCIESDFSRGGYKYTRMAFNVVVVGPLEKLK
jgi:hypothetical protein